MDVFKLFDEKLDEIHHVTTKEKVIDFIEFTTIANGIGSQIFNYKKQVPKPVLAAMLALYIEKIVYKKYNFIQDSVEAYDYVNETLRKTDDYKKLKELYDQYIYHLARLIKTLGDFKSIDLCFIYEYLLEKGLVSTKEKYEFDNASKETIQTIPELNGARIFSGYGMCLDESELLVSLLNEFNYGALTLPVKLTKLKLPTGMVLNLVLYCNHAVTGIVENERTYIFDQTASTLSFKTKDKHIYKERDGLFSRYYYIDYRDIKNLNYGNYSNITLLLVLLRVKTYQLIQKYQVKKRQMISLMNM